MSESRAAVSCTAAFSQKCPFSTVGRFRRRVVTHIKTRAALLLQKVVTDRLGNLSWSCSLDAEVIESWKFLRFRVREYRCKPLHCQSDRIAVASPAVHEQDAASNLAVVFATAVEPGNFLPFPQILIEEIQHLAILAGAANKHKQDQLH